MVLDFKVVLTFFIFKPSTKNKGAFPNEISLLKLVYLATRRIEQKWTSPLSNWILTVQQLAIKFEGRLELDIKT